MRAAKERMKTGGQERQNMREIKGAKMEKK